MTDDEREGEDAPRLRRGQSKRKAYNSTGQIIDEIIESRIDDDPAVVVDDLHALTSDITARFTKRPPGRPRGSHPGLSHEVWADLVDNIIGYRREHHTQWTVLAQMYNRDETTIRAWCNQRMTELQAQALRDGQDFERDGI